MKEQYYTPTVEDFCVGFRYEYRDNYHHMNPKEPDEVVWREYVLGYDVYFESPPCPFGYYKEGQLMTDFRVKYLDQKDLEELGWIETHFPLNDRKSYYKPDFKLVVSEKGVHIFKTKENGEGDFTLFFGQIRNFSELQRVMNQTGIL